MIAKIKVIYFLRTSFIVLMYLASESSIAKESFVFDSKKFTSHEFSQSIINQVIEQECPKGEDFISLLEKAEKVSKLSIQKVGSATIDNHYLYARERTFALAKPYNCGKCDKWHTTAATAWALTKDGIMVSNYHCFSSASNQGVIAVGYYLDSYPVTDILIASKEEDFAIFKVKLPEGKHLKVFPLGESAIPGEEIHLVSNLLQNYFYYSKGYASGYTMKKSPTDKQGSAVLWMQTELGFRYGSSGGAIINNDGEVVGMVSYIRSDFDKVKKDQNEQIDKFALKTFEYTVPISSILKRLNTKR